MGLFQSTQKGQDSQKAADNVRKLFNLEESDDILDTLNIPELHSRNSQTSSINKIPLPIIGGKNDENEEEEKSNKIPGYNFMLGGGQTDIRFKSDRQRYLRYNIFKVIQKLEEVEQMYQNNNQQKGGHNPNGPEDGEEYADITSDNDAINHIKELINKELTSLKNKQSGGCECNDPKPMVGGKKKAKVAAKGKGRKLSRSEGVSNQYDTSSSSSTTNDDSSSDDSSDSENGVNSNSSLHNSSPDSQTESGVSSSQSETMSSQNGGLSIFPFNSSEVRSSRSEKNMKMIRRKI